jgi:hypothetical protein
MPPEKPTNPDPPTGDPPSKKPPVRPPGKDKRKQPFRKEPPTHRPPLKEPPSRKPPVQTPPGKPKRMILSPRNRSDLDSRPTLTNEELKSTKGRWTFLGLEQMALAENRSRQATALFTGQEMLEEFVKAICCDLGFDYQNCWDSAKWSKLNSQVTAAHICC